MTTFDTEQPWVVYEYLTTDRRTRITGRSKILATCAVCGEREVLAMRIPRFGPVPTPPGGKHAVRREHLARHAHPDRGAPMSWALPLLNVAAHPGGVLDVEALAMRIEADVLAEDS